VLALLVISRKGKRAVVSVEGSGIALIVLALLVISRKGKRAVVSVAGATRVKLV
jgi:hypothetical protein